MKITRLLFLGIVLILFNAVYLAAAIGPDTVFVRSNTAKPGDTLRVTVGINVASSGITGGMIIVMQIDSTLTAKLDTAAGWWTADTAYGKKIKSAPTISFDKVNGALSMVYYPVDVDSKVATLGKRGNLGVFKFHVASNTPEGMYSIKVASNGEGVQFVDDAGLLVGGKYPALDAPDIMVANIPDYNALQIGATLPALVGDTIKFPVKVENKDSIGSGSFTLDYPSDQLEFGNAVVAGVRGTGVNFTSTVTNVSSSVKRVTIAFSGSVITPGGLANLCQVYFGVKAYSAAGTVSIGSVALKNAAGGNLAAQASTVAATALGFFYGDTLTVDVQAGDFSVINTQERKVVIPVKLANRLPVSVVKFYIQPDPTKPAGILVAKKVNTTSRTTGWIISADTTGTGLVLAYAPSATATIPAGSGTIFTIEYDILRPLAPSLLPMNVAMTLLGVEVQSNTGAMGMQEVDGVVSLDSRVPNGGESVDPGATLPKAFALAQNSPNPFNPSTTISYQVPEDAGAGVQFSLNVYDLRGRLVKTLAEGFKAPGVYQAFWDGSSNNGQKVSSGVYFYRFASDRYNATRKMVMLK